MLKIKPVKCHGCFDYDSIIETSVSLVAPADDTYWYCLNCKDEVDSGGNPLSKKSVSGVKLEDAIEATDIFELWGYGYD